MQDLAIALTFLAGLYLVPHLAPDRRWLAAIAGLAVAGGLVYWWAWVARQGDPFAYAVGVMTVIICGMAAATGLAVRAVVLRRGWRGRRRAMAVGLGGAVLVLVMAFLVGGLSWR